MLNLNTVIKIPVPIDDKCPDCSGYGKFTIECNDCQHNNKDCQEIATCAEYRCKRCVGSGKVEPDDNTNEFCGVCQKLLNPAEASVCDHCGEAVCNDCLDNDLTKLEMQTVCKKCGDFYRNEGDGKRYFEEESCK